MKRPTKFVTIVLSTLIGFALCADANALNPRKGGGGKKGMLGAKGGGKKGKMGMREAKEPYDYYEAKGLFPTGLQPIFPQGLDCPPISSPYGSQTRFDGSPRNNDHHGYHNGMDITVDPGTPLLAVADGTVIHKGSAGQLVGNFVWLHFAPENTGLPLHIFARYQHLDSESPLTIGDPVKAGDMVGPGGATGTTGGHYGSKGYSHLHLVFYTGPTAEFTTMGPMIGPKSLNYLDPLALFADRALGATTNHALRDLPDNDKAVNVAVRTQHGATIPVGAKLVWPVACK